MSILTHDMSRQTLYLLVLGQLSHSARSSFQLLSLVLLLGFKLPIHLTTLEVYLYLATLEVSLHLGTVEVSLHMEVSLYLARLEVSL